MDWIELLPILRDLGIAMTALIILLVFIISQMRRDTNLKKKDEGLMESVLGLAQTVQKLAESLPIFVEAVRVLQSTMQQFEVMNQKRFETSNTIMGEAGKRRDVQMDKIQLTVENIPASVEAGMEPKLKEIVDTVTVLLDKFQEKLLQQIADLPVVVSAVIENAVADLPKTMIETLESAIEKTKADILAEIRADMTRESSEAVMSTAENTPVSGEIANEGKPDGNE